jgi:hypothetical protein
MDYFSPTDDFRVLVHSATHDAPTLTELEPPRHFHFPPGFVSLVAAGAVLALTAGVQSEVQTVQARRTGHAHAVVARHFGGHHLNPRPDRYSANP